MAKPQAERLENTALCMALDAYIKTREDQKARHFWEALEEAKLLIPVQAPLSPGAQQAGEAGGLQIGFPSYDLADGRGPYFFVFTDWDQASRLWEERIDAMVVTATDVAALLGQGEKMRGVVINPAGQGLLISAYDWKERNFSMQTGQDVRLAEGSTLTFGEPVIPPEPALLDVLTQLCSETKQVKSARLLWAFLDEEKSGHYLLAIEQDGDRQSLFDALAKAAQPFLPDGAYMDILPLAALDGTAKEMKPFYQKKWFRF